MSELEKTNGVLRALAGSDNATKLLTIGLIIVSGGGNFWVTEAGNNFNASEIKRATSEIHELYGLLGQAADRQKRMEELLNQLPKK